MYIAYDQQGDLLHVQFRANEGPSRSSEHPGDRFVEYDDQGVLGIEFLHASEGIDLDGMPHADAIAEALRSFSDLLGRVVRLTPA